MTTDIELALAKGKVEGARKLLQEYYEAQDRQEFEAKLRAEYDELFPSTRTITDSEYQIYANNNGDELPEFSKDEYPKIEIDYSQDDSYITFEEYKNETRVVSEAVYEYDILVTPEVTELVRPYIAPDVTDRVDEYLKSKYAELRAKAYPPMAMFADAWVKNDTEAMEEYRKLCLEVKERFPK